VRAVSTKITVQRHVTPFSHIGTEISELPVTYFLPQALCYYIPAYVLSTLRHTQEDRNFYNYVHENSMKGGQFLDEISD
jgi:hypothetical protein